MILNKKALSLAVALGALAVAAPAMAQEVKLGFLADLTGPIAGFAPGMVTSGTIAIKTINDQGGILDGKTLTNAVADTQCSADAGGPAGDRMVNTEQVTAIFGAFCTGPSIAAANGAAIPGNVVMLSPSATAPAFTDLMDNDLAYRLVVPDLMQGTKGAELLLSKGITTVGLTYVNGDYGKGLADAFAEAFTAGGGTIAATVAHEDGKSDYRPELGQIEAAGATTLVIYGYENAGGGVILDQAIEAGTFTQYVGGDGMAGAALLEGRNAAALEGMIITQAAAAAGPTYDTYSAIVTPEGLDPASTYAAQSYDAVFLLALAIQKNGNAERAGLSAALRDVANEPGEVIVPGEWQKAKDLIAAGTDINYQGASGPIEFNAAGDVAGAIDNFVVQGGTIINLGLIP